MRTKLESLLRNTQKAFTKYGGMLSSNDQEIADRIFGEAEAASSRAEGREAINKALTALERVAGQLTSVMMNPAKESTPGGADDPANQFTKF